MRGGCSDNIYSKIKYTLPDKDYHHYKATISWIDEKINRNYDSKGVSVISTQLPWDPNSPDHK
jgi:hypothetical protein